MDILDARDLDEAEFAAVLDLVRACEQERDPITEPVTAEELRRYILHDRTEGNRHERFAALDGGNARAFGHLELETNADNLHVASAEIDGAAGDPEAGRAVLSHMLDVAAADGRSTLLAWGPDTDAEGVFWEEAGAIRKYWERISALDVSAVDADLMQRWVDRRLERAAEYELVQWTNQCPAELVDAFAACVSALSDAPLDDIDMNPWSIDAADVRRDEESRRLLGAHTMTMMVLAPDGEAAGYTEVHVNPWRPNASWQWGTAVLDRHRQRGLGRWLKAAMWQWLRSAHPEVRRLRTGNAESNAAMLAINEAMGFAPAIQYGAWQGGLDDYRAALR